MDETYEANQGPNSIPNGIGWSATRNDIDFSGAPDAFDSVRIHDGVASIPLKRQRQGRRVMRIVKQYAWSLSWMTFCFSLAIVVQVVKL